MSETILVVEDELVLRETLAYNLENQGYEVHTAEDGPTGVDLAHEVRPDLILLDIMLPGIDGFEVCRLLRKEMNVPILMLTARADEIDKIVGLEVGADDYLTKPFSMRELLARIKALLRRVRITREEVAAEVQAESQAEAARRLTFGNLVIDMDRCEVFRDGESLELHPKEYDLLVCLAQNRGRALSREQLMENVWDWNYTGGSRTVDVHIRWLREKIERDPAHPVRIITVRGIGYRFDG